MPRLQTSLLLHARSQSPLLVPLLQTCRGLDSARNELRWLRQHIYGDNPYYEKKNGNGSIGKAAKALRLKKLCRDRGRGKPLQYILGTEFFGELELECRPGVLIPRPETAALIITLVRRLHNSINTSNTFPQPLRILDLCSGTGCISLLLHHELRKAFGDTFALNILGVDISAQAVNLARKNLKRAGSLEHEGRDMRTGKMEVEFVRADVLGVDVNIGNATSTSVGSTPSLMEILRRRGKEEWDIVISNPPYISPKALYSTTARSVRNFEPRLALVPPVLPINPSSTSVSKTAPAFTPSSTTQEQADTADEKRGDTFYPRLLSLAAHLNAKILLVEVGDTAQAMRVARMSLSQRTCDEDTGLADEDDVTLRRKDSHAKWDVKDIEIWRDGIDTLAPRSVEMVEEDVELCFSPPTPASSQISNFTVGEINVNECCEEKDGKAKATAEVETEAEAGSDTKIKVKIKGPREESEARGVVFWLG